MTISGPVVANNDILPLRALRLMARDSVTPPELSVLVVQKISLRSASEASCPSVNVRDNSTIGILDVHARDCIVSHQLAALDGVELSVHDAASLVVEDCDYFLTT
jgi:hypothetical protein